eukprot:4389760-Alexandrium_andersonii.AAC.1
MALVATGPGPTVCSLRFPRHVRGGGPGRRPDFAATRALRSVLNLKSPRGQPRVKTRWLPRGDSPLSAACHGAVKYKRATHLRAVSLRRWE